MTTPSASTRAAANDPRPPDVVSTRLLAAEATAAAALALIQHPALWETMTTFGLLLETITTEPGSAAKVADRLHELVGDCSITDVDTHQALQLLAAVDSTARSWASIAHPSAGLAETPSFRPT